MQKDTHSEKSRTGLKVLGPIRPGYEAILTDGALAFVAELVTALRDRVDEQLKARVQRQWDPLESTCRHASLSIL